MSGVFVVILHGSGRSSDFESTVCVQGECLESWTNHFHYVGPENWSPIWNNSIISIDINSEHDRKFISILAPVYPVFFLAKSSDLSPNSEPSRHSEAPDYAYPAVTGRSFRSSSGMRKKTCCCCWW
jgi:hypothetical protein